MRDSQPGGRRWRSNEERESVLEDSWTPLKKERGWTDGQKQG